MLTPGYNRHIQEMARCIIEWCTKILSIASVDLSAFRECASSRPAQEEPAPNHWHDKGGRRKEPQIYTDKVYSKRAVLVCAKRSKSLSGEFPPGSFFLLPLLFYETAPHWGKEMSTRLTVGSMAVLWRPLDTLITIEILFTSDYSYMKIDECRMLRAFKQCRESGAFLVARACWDPTGRD
jgi:hypothetical protein